MSWTETSSCLCVRKTEVHQIGEIHTWTGRTNSYVFYIIGMLLPSAREWGIYHADILIICRVIQLSNLEILYIPVRFCLYFAIFSMMWIDSYSSGSQFYPRRVN